MGYKKRTDAKIDKIIEETAESMPESMPDATPEIPMPEALKSAEPEIDAETQRKQEIADKRRASLALARSKIVPKSTLKKQAEEAVKVKDDVIKIKQEETDAMRLKYERDRVKQLEDNLNALQKLIADKPATPVPIPVELPPVKEKYKRPSRAKSAIDKTSQSVSPYGTKHDIPTRQQQQPKQIIPNKSVEPRMISKAEPSTDKLIDKSYGEQLQERLRTQAINKIMNDTFGGF
jgi:hypothetical protein